MPAPTIGAPYMSRAELALTERVFARGYCRYMEFGLGGSTLMAVRQGVQDLVAVDSDPAWVAAVREHPEIAPGIATGTCSIFHADIGPVGAWGAPQGRDHVSSWPSYVRTPWAEWVRRGVLPELVFVDGRFRVACCLSVVVAFGGRGEAGDDGPVVVVHDVTDERPYYREIFDFFDTVEAVESLRVLRIRPKVHPLRAFARLLEYQFDPR